MTFDEVVSEVLREASRVVDQGWCRRYLAVDRCGNECHPTSYDAEKWCAEGAIPRALLNLHENGKEWGLDGIEEFDLLSLGMEQDMMQATEERILDTLGTYKPEDIFPPPPPTEPSGFRESPESVFFWNDEQNNGRLVSRILLEASGLEKVDR